MSKKTNNKLPTLPSADAHRGKEALARVEHMLEVAKAMLVEKGYHRMSLNAVLTESGGSKATFGKYFGNKAGLLKVMLEDEAAICIARAEETARRCKTAEEALRAYAQVVMRFFCRPDSIEVWAAIITEKQKDKEVGRSFYNYGYDSFVSSLAGLLEHWHDRRILETTDANGDAERFLGMLRAGPNDRLAYGLVKRVSTADIKKHVNACVDIFLYGLDKSMPNKPREKQ